MVDNETHTPDLALFAFSTYARGEDLTVLRAQLAPADTSLSLLSSAIY